MEFREPVRQCGWQSHLRDTRIGSTGVVGRSGVCRRAGRTLWRERRRVGGILEKRGVKMDFLVLCRTKDSRME